MGIFGFFGRERYEVRCPHCRKTLKIGPEEVAVRRYTCTVCGQVSPVPDEVHEQHRRAHPSERIRRREAEAQHEQRAEAPPEMEEGRAEREAAGQRAQEERLARRRRRRAQWNAALGAGECPACGGQLQLKRRGYNTEAALAGCLLGGPLGLLTGFIGSGKQLRVCEDCGRQFPFASERKRKTVSVVVIVLLALLVLMVLAILLTRAR